MKQEFPFYKSYEKGKRVNYSRKIEKKLTLSDKKTIADFCLYCSTNSKADKRNDGIKRVMIQFCDFLEKPLDKIEDRDFLYIEEAIRRSGRTTNGKNDVRIVAKRFGSWLEETQGKKFPSLRKKLKIEKVQGSNKIKSPKDLLSELEFDKLLKSTTNIMHKALICLLWESAGRPEEVLKLRWNDIDFDKKNIKLHSAKTGNFRVVPVDISINHLKRLKEEYGKEDGDLIFTSQVNGKQIGNNSFNFILKNLAKKAGIKKIFFSGYTFRHTRLSQLIKTLSPKSYEMFAGHSLEMGMKTYAHLSIDDLTKEMKEKIFGVKELTKEEKDKMEIMEVRLKTLEKAYEEMFRERVEKEGLDFDNLSLQEQQNIKFLKPETITPKKRAELNKTWSKK